PPGRLPTFCGRPPPPPGRLPTFCGRPPPPPGRPPPPTFCGRPPPPPGRPPPPPPPPRPPTPRPGTGSAAVMSKETLRAAIQKTRMAVPPYLAPLADELDLGVGQRLAVYVAVQGPPHDGVVVH